MQRGEGREGRTNVVGVRAVLVDTDVREESREVSKGAER